MNKSFTLIFDKNERKFLPTHYAQTYNIQLQALRQIAKQIINDDCDIKDIKGDVILFYDIHSSHHIKIKGIEKDKRLKLSYLNDPHQEEQIGTWGTGQKFHKLGRKQRLDRERQRGVTQILLPCKEGYYRYLYPYSQGLNFNWIPFGLDLRFFENKPLLERENDILISGLTGCGNYSFYDFRSWVYKNINLQTNSLTGIDYWLDLQNWKAGLALCETYVVAKYYEFSAAGCVPIFQWSNDLLELGWRDKKNCLIVDKNTIIPTLTSVLKNLKEFESITIKARQLVERNFTIEKFVDRIYKVIEKWN